MARPSLRVEIAFSTKPTETATWTDVSEYVRPPMTIRRGRQRELDQVQCGTAELVLDNRDRRFDPLNVDGPYYGQLLPMKRVRILVGDALTPLYSGYVESWTVESFPDGARDSIALVSLVDGFEPLARTLLQAEYPRQRSGARIAQVLNDASWTVGASWVVGSATNGRVGAMRVGPVGDRSLMDGVSDIVAQSLDKVSALQHCQDIADAEGGWFFIDKAGIATFYDRHRLLREPFRTPKYDFGDYYADDEWHVGLAYSGIVYSYSDEWVYNEVSVQTLDGDEQRVVDLDSVGRYFRRTLAASNLPLADDSEALGRARFLLDRYKAPQVRVDELSFEGAIPDETLAALLSLDLGDMVRVSHLPPGSGATDTWSQTSIVQGVAHNIDEMSWAVTLSLAPHHTGEYWQIGIARVGAADMRPAW